MSKVRREVAGAWRSLRYDLSRRPVPADDEPTTEVIYSEYEPRRRLLAATALGVLSLAGAAGAYFGVTGGLSALAGDDSPTRPDAALPAVAPPSRPDPAPPRGTATVAPPSAAEANGTRKPSPRPSATAKGGVPRPVPSPTCACVTPPVPRPTSQAPTGQTPSPEPTSTSPAPPSPTPDSTGAPGNPPPTG